MVGVDGVRRLAELCSGVPDRTTLHRRSDPSDETGLLHIALQEGFEHDEVIVDVAATTNEFSDVSTRMQIGVAQTFDVEVPRGTTSVAVRVQSRGSQGDIAVRVGSEHWLRIDLAADGSVTFTQPDRFRFA